MVEKVLLQVQNLGDREPLHQLSALLLLKRHLPPAYATSCRHALLAYLELSGSFLNKLIGVQP